MINKFVKELEALLQKNNATITSTKAKSIIAVDFLNDWNMDMVFINCDMSSHLNIVKHYQVKPRKQAR